MSGTGDYISREAALEAVWQILNGMGYSEKHNDRLVEEVDAILDDIPVADVRPVPEGGIGEMSDGYHTFNGLYYQRMVLFAALVKAHKDKAWKSLRHEDGELCFGGGWFIVGIDTPQGSYTYHYEDKDWSWFDCVELPVAKHWDGHTEEDVTRLLSLDVRPVVRAEWEWNDNEGYYYCGNCKAVSPRKDQDGEYIDCPNFCPNCGADMREES